MNAPELGPAGRDFWDRTLAVYGLTPGESVLLTSVCRTIDAIEDLDAVVRSEGTMTLGASGQTVVSKAVVEARGQRLALRALLAALALPDASGQQIPTARQVKAKDAATARWTPRTGPSRNAG